MHHMLFSTTGILIVVFLAVVGLGQARAQEVLRPPPVKAEGFLFQAGGLLNKDTRVTARN
jgi:hypothetical protein